MTEDVDAVVLVGGKGTRLRPLTLSAPKPMLPTAGLPFLTHLLSRIAAAGIEHVVLGTSYKPETFEAEFGDGSKLGLQIDYVTEEHPLGTGGGIANVIPKLRNDTVMVFNGDVLSGMDLTDMLATHRERDADVTLHLVRVSDPRAFGCVPTDADGNVLAFLEKTHDPPTDQINAGTYIFKREVLERIPRGREVSVEREVFPALLTNGARVCGYVDATYWRDMGTPEDFVRGSADLVRGIAPGARRRLGRTRRSPVRRDGGRPRIRDRSRGEARRRRGVRRRQDRSGRGGGALHHRVRHPNRTAGPHPRWGDRRRRRHRRPLRTPSRCARLAGSLHPGLRDPLLQRHLTARGRHQIRQPVVRIVGKAVDRPPPQIQ